MKNLTPFLFLLITFSFFAQSPEKMSYQAVIRDATNTLLTNQPVGMQISILQTTTTGTAVYTETQTVTTNTNGLVSLEIGMGDTSDDFSAIDWKAGPYFIKTETDPTGGSSYTITGTSQLLSVPFAMYAKSSGSSETNATNIANNTTSIETNTIAIELNTLKVGITAQQASDITSNNAKTVITTEQSDAIEANTAKTGITSDQATAITANTAKTGITSGQASEIATNTAKVGYTEAAVTANTAVAVNTLKVGITAQQASDITSNNAKTVITTEQSVAIAANTAKTGITSEQATAIIDNTAKVGYTDALVSVNTDVAANTAKLGMPVGTATGEMNYWNGIIWETITPGNSGAVLQMVGTTPTWVSNPDIVAPVITVTSGTDTVAWGLPWTDAGATADTGETVTVSGSVDTSTAGTYTITYTATDASGNVGTATRTVTVSEVPSSTTVFSGLDIYDDGVLYELTATISKDDFRVANGQNYNYSEANQPTYDSNGDILLEMSGSFAEQDVVFWKVDYTFSPALPSTTGSVYADIKSNVGGQNPVGTGSGGSGITSSTSTRTYFVSHIGAPAYPSSQQITAADQLRKMTIKILHKADPNGNPLVLDDSLLVDFNILWLDTVAPVITVTSGTDTVNQGDDWTDAGATADTGETVTVSGSVDTSTIGTYTITYTATDATGNVGTATRTVTVVDNVAPVITVTSGTDIVAQGDDWTDAGATADTGETVTVSGTVNTSTGGIYTITYTASDASGNVGTATRKVVVNAPGSSAKVFSGLDIYDDGVLYELTATISKDYFRVANGQNYNYSEANQPTYDSNGDILLEMSGSFAEQDVVFWKVDYTFSPALPSTTGSVYADIKSNVGGQNPVGTGSGGSGITSSTSTRTYFVSHIGAPVYPSSQQITAADQVRKMTIKILHKADPNGNPLVLDDSLLLDFNVLWLDTVAPVITVTSGVDTIELGSTWTDAGATADTGETVTVSGAVDTNTVGAYTITYTATDAAGNIGTATRTVTVVDNVAPVITVTSGTDTVVWGLTWTDAGATADGGETVTVSGSVDTSTAGTYTITYTATDASGNVGTATRTVTVSEVPSSTTVFSGLDIYDDGVLYELTATISKDYFRVANGQNYNYSEANQPTYDSNGDILLEMSGSFAEQDVVFWKVDYTFSPALPSTTGSVYADIKSNVGGQNPVGTGSGGSGITSSTSTRTYFVSHIGAPVYPSSQQITAADQVRKMTIKILHKADPNGNPLVLDDSLLLDFNVLWLDTVAPVITVTSGVDTIELGSTWTDAGATADTGETVTISGAVDTNTVGAYTITYTATDAAGNIGTATRTVTVEDTTAPVITVAVPQITKRLGDLVDGSLTDEGNGNYTLVSNYTLIENLIIESNETLFINTNIEFNISANVYNKGIIFLTGTTNHQTTINNYGVFVNEGLIKSSNQYEYFYNNSGGKFYNLNLNQGDAITQELYNFTGRNGSVIFDIKSTFNLGRYYYNYGAYTGDYVGGIPEGVGTFASSGDTVAQGATWTDSGATADTGETVVVSGTVDTNTAGIYTITYTATDAAGNVGTATRTVTVDTTAPVILVTPGTDTVEQGSAWTDAGATSDGGETVTASGTVDTSTVGTYTITYTAADAAGNTGTATRTVTVEDTTAPVITVAVPPITKRLGDLVDGSLTDEGNGNYTLVSNYTLIENLIIESNETLFINTNIEFNISANVYNKGIIFLTGTTNHQTTINNYGVFVNEGLIKSSNQYEYFYNNSGGKFYNLNLNQGDAITQELYNFTGRNGSVIFDIKRTFNLGRYYYNYGAYTGDYVGGIPEGVGTFASSGDTVAQFSSWTDAGATADTGETVTASGDSR